MADKMKELMDCFVNPVKIKIITGIEILGQATAKQLLEMYDDIPQATLYRSLHKLEELGLITITEKNQKRGTLEKVYTLNDNGNIMDVSRIIEQNDGEAYLRLFLSFTRSLMDAFRMYARRPDIDILNDGSGFSASPICVTREELQELGTRIAEVIEPYRQLPPERNRENHTLALIFTPPAERNR